MSRLVALTFASLACLLATLPATHARAESSGAGDAKSAGPPFRVAVVGFTGDIRAQDLTELAASVRASLSRQADPKFLVVVTREEMALVYNQRGAPCRPDDVACIIDASEAWQGVLFVRGVVRKASDGVIVGATLEGVHGALVATAQTPPATKYDMNVAVPILVRELLDGEKAYRTQSIKAAQGTDAASTGPVKCKCTAVGATAINGELVADDAGLRFDAAADSVAKLAWHHRWIEVAATDAVDHGANPALKLTSTSSKDASLVVFFPPGDVRDGCLNAIALKKRHALDASSAKH
jgi:hypothetical protein